jgi:hypothetical protein
VKVENQSAMRTMIVKAAPLFATILCLWFGRFAIPINGSVLADMVLIDASNCGEVGEVEGWWFEDVWAIRGKCFLG